MDFAAKLKETLISVVPIVITVLILNFTAVPLGSHLGSFLIGSLLLVAGLSLFLGGVDISMVPVGQKLGSVMASRKSLPLVLILGFIIGFGVTFAEPDVSVLANRICALNPGMNSRTLTFMIAVGLGVFIDLGLFRALKGLSLRSVVLTFYLAVFVLMYFTGQSTASMAFDSSGATTGPLAVPFVLAMGLGVSNSTRGKTDSAFGLTGIASIGPVLAVGLLALGMGGGSSAVQEAATGAVQVLTFSHVITHVLRNTLVGFSPLLAIIIILQLTLLKFPRIRFRNICFGLFYSFVGIVLFLSGVEYGFSEVGVMIGKTLSEGYPFFVLLLVSLVFGAIVVLAEPAVWVLTDQIENVSAGRIRKRQVMVFMCMGVSAAVALAMLRVHFSINYLYFVFGGVGMALILSFFSPSLFTGIAFDSGGVASGPLSTSFLLSVAIGASDSPEMSFGLVGLIAISPLITLQILGIIFRVKEKKTDRREENADS